MQTITLELDTASHAKYLAGFLKTVPYIKSVVIEPRVPPVAKLTEEDWIKPGGRPATDEEFEEMISEAEKGPFLSLEESRRLNKKKFSEWRKQNCR